MSVQAKYLFNSPIMGYAHHRIILDEAGIPMDYEFLQVNATFEKLTGLESNKLLGRTVREVIPGIESSSFDWIAYYGSVALNGGEKEFEQYSEALGKWYRVHVYSVEKNTFTTMFIDSTETKKSAQILAESESFKTELLRNVSAGVVVIDPETRCIELVNEYAQELFGAPKETLLGRRCHSFLCPAEENKCPVCDLGRSIDNSERLMLRADGTAIPILKTVKHITLAGKDKLLESFVDISRQKKTESALQESERTYRHLVENLPGITYRASSEEPGTMLYISKVVDSITGYSPEEFLGHGGQALSSLVYGEDHESRERAIREAVAGNQSWDLQYRIRCKDGSLRWVQERGRAYCDEQGKVGYLDGFILDINQRKEVEASLDRERNLFAAGPVFSIEWDPSPGWPVRLVSSNVEAILGYGPEELKAKDFFYEKIIHPDDLERIRDEVNHNTLNHVDAYDQSYRLRTKSGPYRWFHDFTRLVRDARGRLLAIQGYLYDESSQKEAEAALAKERYRLANIIEGTNVGTWEWNVQTGETVFNERWADIVGYTLAEISPVSIHTWSSFAHPEDIKNSADALARHFSGELPYYECESRMRHKSGDWIWVLDRGKVASWTDDGKPLLMMGTHQEISARKKAEEGLHEATMRLSLAAKAAGLGVWDYDVVNNKLLWDSQMFALYGIEKSDFTGVYEAWRNGLHPEDLERGDREISCAIQGSKDFNTEFRVIWPDHSVHHIRAMALVIRDASGKALRMIGTNWDITQQKENEAALHKAKDQAEAANKAKSAFLANMSHEIRTPLNGVIGFTDLLQNTPLTPLQLQYVQNANASGHTLLGIISDILDFSKIEAGMLELELVRTDLRELMESSMDMVKVPAAKKELELLLRIDPSMPRFVLTDPLRLKQILVNLLANAVKFTLSGEVELSVRFEVRAESRASLFFAVRDTGMGISEEQQTRLFKAFSQADSSTTRKFGGTGLGLIISDLIAQKFGGKIGIVSTEGRGATFSFSIVADFLVQELAPPPVFTNLKSCLILDDNSTQGDILRDLLAYASIPCRVARSGEEGLQALEKEGPFDLILCDFRMSPMDGPEFISLLRQKHGFQRADQAIVLMQYFTAEVGTEELFRDLGPVYRVQKPIRQGELFGLLASINNPSLEGRAVPPGPHVDRDPVPVSREDFRLLIAEDVPLNMTMIRALLGKLLPSAHLILASNGREAVDFYKNMAPHLVFMDVQMPEWMALKRAGRSGNLRQGLASTRPLLH